MPPQSIKNCFQMLFLMISLSGHESIYPAEDGVPDGHDGVLFVRGDVNLDKTVDLSDAVFILKALFSPNERVNMKTLPCRDAADANDDGELDLTDGIFLLSFLFLGTDQPPYPFTECGFDLVFTDKLECKDFPYCQPFEITNEVEMRFVYIPPGSFFMGSPSNERGRQGDELSHRVNITCGFYISTTEVTQKQYLSIMEKNPSYFNGGIFGTDLNRAVESVSWYDAMKFCSKLSEAEIDQKGIEVVYRLPTEAEWEYAARADTDTRFWMGDLLHCSDFDEPFIPCHEMNVYEWWYGTIGGTGIYVHAVGQKLSNLWGLFDIYGNVWEWCFDWYAPYSKEEATNPKGPSTGQKKVYRGDAFNYLASGRSAWRGKQHPSMTFIVMGFRVVRELPGCSNLYGLPTEE